MVGLIDWTGDAGFCMKKLVLITSTISMLLGGSAGLSQSRACLRIMTVDELAKGSTFIGRVKVVKAEKINYRGAYGQLATVVPTEVIDGDFTLKKLNVLSKSNVQCAEDNYVVGQEMLVFLVPEESLFRTLNFQYGQFQIVGNMVRGWRDKANKPVDKLYADAQKEIECILNPIQAPPGGENNPPRSPVPGAVSATPPASSQALSSQPGVQSTSPKPTASPSPKPKNSSKSP
jgi:hypothetical protein